MEDTVQIYPLCDKHSCTREAVYHWTLDVRATGPGVPTGSYQLGLCPEHYFDLYHFSVGDLMTILTHEELTL